MDAWIEAAGERAREAEARLEEVLMDSLKEHWKKAGVANLVALQWEQKRRDLLLIGWAEIGLDTTREVVYINELTQATLYRPERRIRITNLGGRNRATAVFEIAGAFSSPEAGLHVLLSRGAAERLGMERGRRFWVRLEPVE